MEGESGVVSPQCARGHFSRAGRAPAQQVARIYGGGALLRDAIHRVIEECQKRGDRRICSRHV
eukprot:5127367-Lingulodinium_polyedra.AAC.1